MAFAVLGFSQLFHVRNLNSNKRSSFRTGLLSNRSLVGAILISGMLLLTVLTLPGMMKIFGVVRMDTLHWFITGALSLVPILVVELMKWMKINHSKDEY
jgi:Ca2+-transporting ATPase